MRIRESGLVMFCTIREDEPRLLKGYCNTCSVTLGHHGNVQRGYRQRHSQLNPSTLSNRCNIDHLLAIPNNSFGRNVCSSIAGIETVVGSKLPTGVRFRMASTRVQNDAECFNVSVKRHEED